MFALCLWVLAMPAVATFGRLARGTPTTAPAVKPKPLSDNVERGLVWLAQHQLESGAWGQGEESKAMGRGAALKDRPSVGDTCIALLALLRGGNTPEKGPHAKSVAAGVRFVCAQVEEADVSSPFVTKLRGTRIQQKLGVQIDTFLTSLMLTEVQEKTEDKDLLARVTKALEKVLRKIEKNQKADGTWGKQGWAQTLEQGMAVKALNRAAQAGNRVDDTVREKARTESRKRFDKKSGKFSKTGSAGVDLYATASSLGGQQDSVNTDGKLEQKAREQLKNAKTEKERKAAETKLKRYAEAKRDLDAAREAVVAKISDRRFIAGFGSNGGEEFLSYMTIGESLVVKGGDAWKKWDESMTRNMNKIQNADGSWTGHHCITGRTFCTSAALLVLMVDRTPVPLAAKIRARR